MTKDWTGNAKSIFTCHGASNHSQEERQEHDYYATEPKAVELLLERETFSPCIWECACGEGHISEVLKAHGYNVVSSDLYDRGYEGTQRMDFLSITEEQRYNIRPMDIITNPPYKFAKEFVEHALDISKDGTKVAMFLKLTFLEGKARKLLFEKYPPEPYMFLQQDCNVQRTATLKSTARALELLLLMLGLYGKRASPGSRKLNGYKKSK